MKAKQALEIVKKLEGIHDSESAFRITREIGNGDLGEGNRKRAAMWNFLKFVGLDCGYGYPVGSHMHQQFIAHLEGMIR